VSEARTLWGLCAAVIVICGVMVSAPSPVHAGNNKPDFVRVPADTGLGRFGSNIRTPFGPKVLATRGNRPSFVRRRDYRRRPFYGSAGYYYPSAYGYQASPVYINNVGSAPGYQSQAGNAAPADKPPVTPKWVHVGGDVATGLDKGAPAAGGLGRNCLSVKTQITVDGAPVDAFGEACLLADGSWELQPSKQAD
jgi:hypothetical protein